MHGSIDYKSLGFACGLEIHQQLEGRKLFCNCPAINSQKAPDICVQRNLRAVAGETGEIDRAAAHEMAKQKRYIYVSNSQDTCLVEYDEEPPKPMDRDLLKAALEISLMLNARIVDEIQVMRKTVVDGSNVTGFQRTALIAMDGYVETSMGKVRIPSICLEEEAAQKLEDAMDYTQFKLDRLGIALIEIATDIDIVSPEHAKETAEKIGMILRSGGKVKRGLGTIRQDVNISIKGGARTEIKGFQDLKSIPKVIEQEIIRQQELIKAKKKIVSEVRKAEPDFSTSFLRPMPGAARMYPETDVLPVRPEKIVIEKKELIEEKAARFEAQYHLSKDLASKISRSDKAALFDEIAKTCVRTKPAFIAETLVSYEKELIRDCRPCRPELVTEDVLRQIFSAIEKGMISKDSVAKIIIDVAKKQGLDLDKYKVASAADIEKQIKEIAEKNKGAPFGAVMGQAMKQFNGNVDGKIVSELLRKYLK